MDLLAEKQYDFIHLNSYVLYPLLTKKYPMYIHIRELCNAAAFPKRMIQRKIRESRGIIYIDYPTKEALGVGKHSMVLNNPFDQTNVPTVDLQEERKQQCQRQLRRQQTPRATHLILFQSNHEHFNV